MGESGACLVRSFSQPSPDSSREAKQGDPIRALGESISFGRFMSESLAWEKWSTFSHNRYLEEAEKSSKPGTVAQKKAYFEAQYKKIAAKRAAALLEQQNLENNNSREPNTTPDSNLENSNNHAEEVVDVNEVNLNVERNDVNEVNLNVERNESEIAPIEEPKLEIEECVNTKESPPRVELPSSHENAECELVLVVPEEEVSKDAANEGTPASTSTTKIALLSKKPTGLRTLGQAKKGDKSTPNSKKFTRDSIEKKRSTPKSLHMSMNFGSQAKETSKILSPVLQKIGNSRIVKAFVKTSKDAPTKASATGVLRHPSRTALQKSIRAKEPSDHSVNGSRKVDKKLPLPILSSNRMKSSIVRGTNTRESALPSSFSFKREERAVKLKEKAEEKANAKGAEKPQLQAKSKEKTENEFKKMPKSTGLKAKLSINIPRETESRSNQIKKIPLVKPPSTKLGRSRTSGVAQETTKPPSPKLGKLRTHGVALDITSRPPWRPSNKNAGSKSVAASSNWTLTRSTNSLPKKKNMHENASPNIQPREK